MSLVDELKRRNVLRVVFAYLVVGWLLTEVLTTILPELGAPDWASRAVILVFALGFVPAAVLPWVFEVTPEGIKRESQIARDGEARGSTRTFDYVFIAAVVVLILVVAVLGARVDIDESPPPSVSNASVAVLPFANMTGDPKNDYFSDGLTETLLHMLTQIPELQVSARTSSFAFRNESKTIREIASILQVAHVLEGSVQLAGNRVRVTAQLIRASDGFHVWSKNYNRDFDDIFLIQDEIASEVGKALTVSLLGEQLVALVARVGTDNPDAYDLYLQAIGERATYSYGGLQAAENLLKGALATDPTFLDAKTELAINYMLQFKAGLMDHDDAMALCSALTAQVLEARPDDPVARALDLFGEVAGHDGSHEPGRVFNTIAQLETLVADNPGEYQVRLLLSEMLQAVQQFDRALILNLEASRLEPFNARIHFELGSLYLQTNQLRKARESLEESLRIEPRQPNAHAKLAQVNAQLGDGVGVVQQMLKAFEVDPRDHELPGAIALYLYELGLVDEGDDFRDLVFAFAPTSEMAYRLALRRALVTGDNAMSLDSARSVIEDGVGERSPVFSEAVRYLMRTAAEDGTLEATTAYIEKHAPGVFDIGAESVLPQHRDAQIAAFDAWYVALPRDELLQRLDDILEYAADFGVDPLKDPRTRLGIQALRGETEPAIETALQDVLPQPVTTDLELRDRLSLAQYADIVADDRVGDALQRWESRYDEMRERVKTYLAQLSAAA